MAVQGRLSMLSQLKRELAKVERGGVGDEDNLTQLQQNILGQPSGLRSKKRPRKDARGRPAERPQSSPHLPRIWSSTSPLTPEYTSGQLYQSLKENSHTGTGRRKKAPAPLYNNYVRPQTGDSSTRETPAPGQRRRGPPFDSHEIAVEQEESINKLYDSLKSQRSEAILPPSPGVKSLVGGLHRLKGPLDVVHSERQLPPLPSRSPTKHSKATVSASLHSNALRNQDRDFDAFSKECNHELSERKANIHTNQVKAEKIQVSAHNTVTKQLENAKNSVPLSFLFQRNLDKFCQKRGTDLILKSMAKIISNAKHMAIDKWKFATVHYRQLQQQHAALQIGKITRGFWVRAVERKAPKARQTRKNASKVGLVK
jgi:hypothetical protein